MEEWCYCGHHRYGTKNKQQSIKRSSLNRTRPPIRRTAHKSESVYQSRMGGTPKYTHMHVHCNWVERWLEQESCQLNVEQSNHEVSIDQLAASITTTTTTNGSSLTDSRSTRSNTVPALTRESLQNKRAIEHDHHCIELNVTVQSWLLVDQSQWNGMELIYIPSSRQTETGCKQMAGWSSTSGRLVVCSCCRIFGKVLRGLRGVIRHNSPSRLNKIVVRQTDDALTQLNRLTEWLLARLLDARRRTDWQERTRTM